MRIVFEVIIKMEVENQDREYIKRVVINPHDLEDFILPGELGFCYNAIIKKAKGLKTKI